MTIRSLWPGRYLNASRPTDCCRTSCGFWDRGHPDRFLPDQTRQSVKDFSCFHIPRGGREIVGRKRKIVDRTISRRVPKSAGLCRGKYFFSKFWEGSIRWLNCFQARLSVFRAEQANQLFLGKCPSVS